MAASPIEQEGNRNMPPLDARGTRYRVAGDTRLPPEASKCSVLADDSPRFGEPWTFTGRAASQPAVPSYLKDTYTWAYLRPTSVWLLDRPLVVNAILWGNFGRLLRAALAEMRPGQRVYQPACVYGDFSRQVAEVLGPDGHLDVGDVAPVQVENCRHKLSACGNARVHLWDAADKRNGVYDVVCCFFLLHEIPETYKHRVVDALLGAMPQGGKVVFVDYHGPHWAHPLKWLMSFVNDTLEPFAKALWTNEIASYASRAEEFTWSKQTYFGGLYQKVVAERR
jgi:ubiquinone/menaquinone biosynthesis C-methylase UbiE